ncbi:MAG: hypothetical protein ACRYFS_01965 [Janthinobacterium lividum]
MTMQLTQTELRFDHLETMLTSIGLWQHAEECHPNPRHGYSIDDEARGLIVSLRYWQAGIEPQFYGRMAGTCFRFVEGAAITKGESAGQYHNFCDTQGKWLDSVGSEDSFGRTIWGLGVAHAVNAPFAPREIAEKLLRGSLSVIPTMRPTYLRAKAFVILGLSDAQMADDHIHTLADALADAYEATSDPYWHWFEDQMTYCNARLPQALFVAARLFPDEQRYKRIAIESLDFLLEKTRNGQGSYDPIGNLRLTEAGWFTRHDQEPPRFDQQPVDAGALVECCAEAYHVTGERRFRQAAQDAFDWYLGRNHHGLPVFDALTGGVSDALTPGGLNRNQGAESVLSVHLAHQALKTLL